MKVIDLLNKIANGEEVPKKIKYKSSIYNYREQRENKIYQFEDTHTVLTIQCFEELNEEVEIIEDDKKLEKIDVNHLQQIKKWKRAKILGNKINEIIDYLGDKQC